MNFNGTIFYFEEVGNGEAIVFVHAGICDSGMWDEQFEMFAEQFRVVRYDMRGFGKTAVSDNPFSHHDDLHALMEHLGIERAHLIGCSKGGGVALDFALAYPERVCSVTMVCSSPGGYKLTGEIPPQWESLLAAFKAREFDTAAELDIQIWVDGWQHRQSEGAPSHIRERVREMDLIALRNEALELGEERPLTPPANDRLTELTHPLLLITAALDDEDLELAAKHMVAQIPHAHHQIIQNAAHLPNMEQPEEFNRILLNFLEQ